MPWLENNKIVSWISIAVVLISFFGILIVPNITHAADTSKECSWTDWATSPIQCGKAAAGNAVAGVLGTLGEAVLAALYPIVWLIYKALGIVYWLILGILAKIITISLTADFLPETTITKGWMITRDIFNIGFMFAILYTSITTILGYNKEGAQKALGFIITAALLVNFSLAITRTAIDASNIVANEFWSKIHTEKSSLESKLDKAMSPASLFGAISNTAKDSFGLGWAQSTITYAAGSIFMVISIFALAAAAGMFFVRLIVMAILMIFSPIAFVDFLFSGNSAVSGFSKQWWTEMTAQLTFPIVFLFLLYMSVLIMSVFEVNVADKSIIPILIKYSMGIGLLMAAVTMGKKSAGSAGEMGAKLGGAMFAGGAAAGGLAFRQTAGRYGASMAKGAEGQTGFGAEAKRYIGGTLAGVSGDVRDLPKGIGGAVGGAAKLAGMSEATSKKIGGLATSAVSGIGEAAELSKVFGKDGVGKAGGEGGFAGGKKADAEINRKAGTEEEKAAKGREYAKNRDAMKGAGDALTKAEADLAADPTNATKKTARDDAKKASATAAEAFNKSAEGLITDPERKEEIMKKPELMAVLNSKNLKALNESKDVTEEEKKALETTVKGNADNVSGNQYYRNKNKSKTNEEDLMKTIEPGTPIDTTKIQSALKKINGEQLIDLLPKILANNDLAGNLNMGQLEEIMKNGDLDTAQKSALKSAINLNASKNHSGAAHYAIEDLKKWDDDPTSLSPAEFDAAMANIDKKNITKVPKEILLKTEVAQKLTVEQLDRLPSILSEGEQKKIMTDIATGPANSNKVAVASYLGKYSGSLWP